jgi:hypothetical protein
MQEDVVLLTGHSILLGALSKGSIVLDLCYKRGFSSRDYVDLQGVGGFHEFKGFFQRRELKGV